MARLANRFQFGRHLIERNHAEGKPVVDCRARHTVYYARFRALRDGISSRGPNRSKPCDAIFTHARHKNGSRSGAKFLRQRVK